VRGVKRKDGKNGKGIRRQKAQKNAKTNSDFAPFAIFRGDYSNFGDSDGWDWN
jgi:hypothetical protein